MYRPLAPFAALLCLMLLAGCLPPAGGLRGIVKIGLVAPFSGDARGDGYSIIYAVKLALDEWNARGGIQGYRFELVALDDNADPSTAAQRAKELNVDQLVVGVIGHYSGDTTLAALPVYRQAGMPLVVPLASASEATSSDWSGTVRIGANDQELASMLANQNAGTWKAHHAILLYQDTPANAGMIATISAAIGNENIVEKIAIPRYPTPAILDSLMEEIRSKQPDLLLYSGSRDVAAPLAERAHATMSSVRLVLLPAPEMDAPELVKLGGNGLENALYAALWTNPEQVNTPVMADFKGAYQKLAGAPPRSSSVLAYDAANVLFAAIQRAIEHDGRPTRAGVARVLRMVEWNGLTGQIQFNVHGEATNAKVYLYRIVVGRYPGEYVASGAGGR